jgi:crossover junction endodeoxyribonuclease RusA
MSNSVRLPWPPVELSPNYHGKLRNKMRAKKAYRQHCWAAAMEAKLKSPCPAGKIALKIEFFPPDRRSRDDDNLISRFKHGRDGIAQAIRIDDKRFRTVPTFHDEIVPGGEIIVTLEPL